MLMQRLCLEFNYVSMWGKKTLERSFPPFFSKSAEPKPSGAMYISQRAIQKSFCGAFFKKRQRKTAFFFLRSFFFCASCVKRKSESMKINVAVNQHIMFTLCFFDSSSVAFRATFSHRRRLGKMSSFGVIT